MKKWNVAAIRAAKGVEKLGCCTAYDACFARLEDEAGVPIILVGDSMGMNTLGYSTTLPVEMSDTLAAVGAVARVTKDALVVGDMPFGSYQCGEDQAMANAVAIIKAGADAVKLEGGASVCPLIRRLTTAGIPVLAHVGMTPQSVNEYGGFKKQGKTRETAEKVLDDAKAVEAAGAFAVTLECIPAELAAEITAALKIITIGIGAGPVCDAQWLVMHDLLGLNEKTPSFVKRYAELASAARGAFSAYVNEVRNGVFPSAVAKFTGVALMLLALLGVGMPTAEADELPITWQRFCPASATNGTPAAETLTIATVAFDANVPVDGKALDIFGRVKTNLLRIAATVRQVKSACKAKGGAYADAPILVCFPEESVTGIVEVDKDGRRGFDRYRGGVFGTIDEVPLSDWIAYLGPEPFPRDAVTRSLRDIATNENVYISCGYDVRNPHGRDRYRNVCALFGPEKSAFITDGDGYGIIGYHYKAHPIGAEREYVQRGEEFRVWPTRVGKIGMLICYDIFFPESARVMGLQRADVVIAAMGWPRAYATAYPGGVEIEGRRNDGPGIEADGCDDRSRTYVDMAIRVAAFRNGYYFVVSNLANPGGLGHSAIVYPTGRVMCESRGNGMSEESGYLPGIAIANIGKATLAHEISVSENTGFDFMPDRYPPAYRPIVK